MGKKKLRLGKLIIVGLLVYLGYLIIQQQGMLDRDTNKLKTLQSGYKEQVLTNQKLEKQKSMLETDEYYEKVAREELGMVKPGEKKYVDINR